MGVSPGFPTLGVVFGGTTATTVDTTAGRGARAGFLPSTRAPPATAINMKAADPSKVRRIRPW